MIIGFKDLKTIRKKYKNRKIIFASGVFDLFHVGHLCYLRKAEILGDILIVNVVNDKRVKFLKGGHRPVIEQKHRAKIIDSLKCVDYVVVNPLIKKGVSLDTVKKLQPDIFILNTLEKERLIMKACPNIRLILNPEMRITSTTRIIKKILSQNKPV